MLTREGLLLLCFLGCLPFASSETELFREEITQHFVEPHLPGPTFEKAAKLNKPVMVIVMTQWCAACNALRKSVNAGNQVRDLMSSFVVAYSDDDAGKTVWQLKGEEYVPQILFFNPAGRRIDVRSNRPEFKHFFGDEASLLQAMQMALDLNSHPDHSGPDPENVWASDISAGFFESFEPTRVREKAAADGKPFMVVLTQPWCDACHDLMKSVNGGEAVRKLLPQFVVAHAHGEKGTLDWQKKGEGYVPQAYFFNSDGSPVDVPAPQAKYKHFFANDDELAAAMKAALEMKSEKEL